ncbi:MAG: accessory Sec system translocase SecA2 [Pseudobutyrivibrio sp.]|nr:accessory Sec system translocase SecA2 [Pseudobutyrivibrio sp.]
MKSRIELHKLRKILAKIKECEKRIEKLSDQELSEMTKKLKKRYQSGESLDRLLPEAFAVMIEADDRVLKKRPYDVQVLAGIALHQGYMAEMNTGEGKTLAATMPLYLNALSGKPCILVTTNSYLAARDGQEMGEVYQFMGLTCSYPDADEKKKMADDERKAFYRADIIYTTNSGLGFDYLFHNLVKKKEDRFLCDLNYCIIDEADAVLLDSAVMPLVISGVPRVQSNLYRVCDFFVTSLTEDIDYIEEDGAVWLTPKGVQYAENFFGIQNFYGKENFEINRHVTLALRAHMTLKNNKDYVVTDHGKVELFDGATGRLMHGVKLRGGQHQAIEAKEKIEISQEYRTVASVTFQNLFMMFDKMAGMSGTIMDAKDEMFDVYQKKVIKIPSNRPVQRVDRRDLYYVNAKQQFWAAANDLIKIHETGQPVLVVLNSVSDTDLFSRIMIEKNIPHNVLNASNAFWEAQIIAGAGQKGAVTIATTMAGRGTDIKLGKGVKELGGLAVLGIGRMDNVRSERQARGRSGRQGDPGFSQFYVSLEDDIVGAEDDEKIQWYIDEERHISKHKIKRIINQSQKLKVEMDEMGRKKSVQYDEVLQRQRDLIYKTRAQLLEGARVKENLLLDIARENIVDYLQHQDTMDLAEINRYILDNVSYSLDDGLKGMSLSDKKALEEYLMKRVYEGIAKQKASIYHPDAYEQFLREAILNAVDEGWVELIDYLEQLKYAVAGRASAQRNIMFEYQNEAFESYLDTVKVVKRNIIRNVLLSDVTVLKDARLKIVYP